MATKQAGRSAQVLLATLLLAAPAACQRGAEVKVLEDRGSATVSVALNSGNQPACIDDLTIIADGTTAPLWHVAAEPGGACISTLVLGHEPAAFAPDTGMNPPRLLLDRSYRVEVSGRGFIAATHLAAGRSAAPHAMSRSPS